MSESARALGAAARRVSSEAIAATASESCPDATNASTFASSVLQLEICDSTLCRISISAASCKSLECLVNPLSRTGTRPDYRVR